MVTTTTAATAAAEMVTTITAGADGIGETVAPGIRARRTITIF
jgi:hypothetical protein